MRKVPPILKPIAVLTISVVVATTTGVINSSSYRAPQVDQTEKTSNTMVESQPTQTVDQQEEVIVPSETIEQPKENNQSEVVTPPTTTSEEKVVEEQATSENKVEQTTPSVDAAPADHAVKGGE